MRKQLLFALALFFVCVTVGYTQNSAFTYQGLLWDNNEQASGSYDFQFRLRDAQTNGHPVGPIIARPGIPVSDGLFSVLLDFGTTPFDGSPRWLELAVRTNESIGAFTVLEPCQPIATTPYAMLANSAGTAAFASGLLLGAVLTNVSVPGGNIQPGTIPASAMDLATDAAYRNVPTNIISAILSTSSVAFSRSAASAALASNLVPGAVLLAVSLHGSSIQPGTITPIQIDPATDAAYRAVPTNVLTAIVSSASVNSAASAAVAAVASNLVSGAVLTNVSIHGGTIQPGTITATQIDPDTDAAYRSVNTNAVTAIVALASANFASTAATAGIASNLVAGAMATNLLRLDVKQVFGAKGDGTSDDTVAIQSALDYLANDSASNATLYFAPGSYRVLRTLSVPPTAFPKEAVLGNNSGYRITGAGLSVTKLVWPSIGSGIGLAMTNVSGYEGVALSDLTLVGPLMTAWDTANASIGLAVGKYGADTTWSGRNNSVRNVGLIGWAYAAAVTNQWTMVFDNCIITSNSIEGLHFAGSHGVSVQNCSIGGGWSTPVGTGIGFHPPLNAGYGDNAQIMNCIFGLCTNGIINNELNLLSLNNHLESCGSYYTLVSSAIGPPTTTIIGGYTLDFPLPLTNGFAGQMLMDAPSAARTTIENCWFTTAFHPDRPIFNVLDDGSGFTLPTCVGNFPLLGLWDTTTNVTLYPFGKVPTSLWTYQMPLKNGPDFTSGINIALSPNPWNVAGAMQVAGGSVGIIEFGIPYGMGFSNLVLELTVQPGPAETNMAFSIAQDNYSVGAIGPQRYGPSSAAFSGITNGHIATFYWTNSFGEDIYPRHCHYTIGAYEDPQVPLTNDLWIVSWRLFSSEMSGN